MTSHAFALLAAAEQLSQAISVVALVFVLMPDVVL